MFSEKDDTHHLRLLLDDDAENAANMYLSQKRTSSRSWLVIALSVSNLVLLALLLFSHIDRLNDIFSAPAEVAQSDSLPSMVFSTEIADALPYVEYTERTFSGELAYNTTSKRLYREVDSSEPQYFGPASPEIDAAWRELLKDEFVAMTPEEASPFGAELRDVMGVKKMEPSYMHGLHCLNALRKKLDPGYYADKPSMWKMFPAELERTHDDHCLHFLFQQITCAGDLTPSPLYSWDGFGMLIGRSGVHTCRKTEKLMEWAGARNERTAKGKVGSGHLNGETSVP